MATDTIAAIATPPGQGGVGIVRVSGDGVVPIAKAMFGRLPEVRHAELHDFRAADGQLIDTGLVLYFAAPCSFTGEHVLELQGHGGPVVMDLLLQHVFSLGARPARPGEFSRRAFLNNKLDLVQAEAIADLIESGTAQAARAAVRSLHGAFSARIHELAETLTTLRIHIEASIDFPDEDVDLLADTRLMQMINALQDDLSDILARANQGKLLRDGMTLVIAGRPNAGKSSLLNALAGSDTAIVTEIPGTTRDVLREHIQIDGMPLHVIDTAGLHDSNDPVEQLGMQRARQAMVSADRLLLLMDDRAGFTAEDEAILDALPDGVPHTLVFNKIDLTGGKPGARAAGDSEGIAISVHSGAGMDELRRHLKQCVGFADQVEGSFSARRRHIDILLRVQQHILSGRRQLEESLAGELLAEELRLAQQGLGEITGEVSSDDLLGRIFSSFCIGK